MPNKKQKYECKKYSPLSDKRKIELRKNELFHILTQYIKQEFERKQIKSKRVAILRIKIITEKTCSDFIKKTEIKTPKYYGLINSIDGYYDVIIPIAIDRINKEKQQLKLPI